jgi:hypothetical protein
MGPYVSWTYPTPERSPSLSIVAEAMTRLRVVLSVKHGAASTRRIPAVALYQRKKSANAAMLFVFFNVLDMMMIYYDDKPANDFILCSSPAKGISDM